MKCCKRFYQRLYGLLSLLLLLQECHPLIRNGYTKRAYKSPTKDTVNDFHSLLMNMQDNLNQFDNNPSSKATDIYDETTPPKEYINSDHLVTNPLYVPNEYVHKRSNASRGKLVDMSRNASIHKHRRSVEKHDEDENDDTVSVETINEQINVLSRRFVTNQKDVETKVNSYVKHCSTQYSNDLEVFGSIKTPSGIMTRLMLSMLYTIANCQAHSMRIITEITEQIGSQATLDMLKSFAEIAEELTEKSNLDIGTSDEDTEEDVIMPDEESKFLSGLVAENILNSQEMLKLFDVLANNEEFENNTDLNEVLSEFDTFSLTELVDKPNYRWIQYPIASGLNSTTISKQPKVNELVKRLNSNATKRIMREISVPANFTSKTDILVIYDRTSYKLLSATDEGLVPTLRKYDDETLPEQLWILDEGALTNIATRLSLHIRLQENIKSVVLQRHSNISQILYNLRGRLSYNLGDNDCFLDTDHNMSLLSSPVEVSNITIRCDAQIQDVQLVIASFSDVNTPETLALHQPESVDFDPISKHIGFKFIFFMYLLGYMFRSVVIGDKSIESPSYNNAKQVALRNTFFIKHDKAPCKVLMAFSVEDKYEIVLGEFGEDIIEYQLWYWKESQIINVATHEVLKTNYLINAQGKHEEKHANYFSLWTNENNTIQSLNKQNCKLDISDSSENILLINCSKRGESNVKGSWSFVNFDQPNFDNFQKVVCMFFIQTTLWPCEFISSSEMYAPSLTPLTDNIYSQLWYMSNGRLINIDHGLAITEINDDTNMTFIGMGNLTLPTLTTWYMMDGQIYPSSNRNSVLTIDMSKNGILSITKNDHTLTQYWNIIDFKTAFENETNLQCADDTSVDMNPFVIRNNAIPACKILTVVENNNTFELQMKGFDKALLEFQTWIIYRNHIINMASGLTIEPDIHDNDDSMDNNLMLRPVHSFQQKQMWTLDADGVLRWHLDNSCFISYSYNELGKLQDNVSMKCKVDHGFSSMWTFADLPTDDNSANNLDFMCIYFIKSLKEPCQYITANIDDGSLHLRPLVPELLKKQLWLWSEQAISLVTTGHYIGTSKQNTNMAMSELLLMNPDEGHVSASWKFNDNKLIEINQQTQITLDTTYDGELFFSSSKGNYSALDLTFVNYDEFLKDYEAETCDLPITGTSPLYFIRSKIDKCKVLTGANVGKQPTFENFNQEMIQSQLWFYEDNHLINFHSNLVLHANANINTISGSQVIMQNYYKYATAQKWRVSSRMIFFGNSDMCVLDVDKASVQLIVSCEIHSGDTQIWERIGFDNDGGYLDEITCMFFLRHEKVPCELLTSIYENQAPKLRPVSESHFNNQIWYWSGQHIVNAATGQMLYGYNANYVSMREKTNNIVDGEWIINGEYISLKSKPYLIIGLNSESGTIQLYNKYGYLQNAYTKWSVIDLEAGIKDPTLLICEENIRYSTIYLIKSEKDPCNILTENWYGDITLQKAGHVNQAWVKIRRHIVNAKTRNVLSTLHEGALVKPETRFEHEIRQHWYRHGSSVRTTVRGQTKLLDSYNDVSIYNQDDSDGQKWTWHNIRDVENESKLLRCSKCFNQGEEKANEIISYIPIFGWLYSLFRAPVYAAKGCDDVALESLMSFGIDIGLDIVFAAVTVLTAGMASSLAYGIKTGVKFGFKAGLKAGVRAITSSVKLAVRQGLKVGKTVLKQGLKKTVLSMSRHGLTSIKTSMKSTFKLVKKIPRITKYVVVKTGKAVKTLPTKVFNSIKSTTYGSFKSSVKSSLRKIPKALKTRIKKIGNRLADNAEKRIKKFDKIKNKSPTSHIRCKRADTCGRVKPHKKQTHTKPNVPTSAFVKEPTEDVANNFKQLLKIADKDNHYDLNGLQNAHFGLTKKAKNKNTYFDKDSVRSKDLSEVSELPYDKEYRRLGTELGGNKLPQSHTEQGLHIEMTNAVRSCKGQCDEFYMWTKNSPCMINTYKHIGNAKSCFAILVEFCYDMVKVAHKIKKCNIGFSDFYGYKGKNSVNSKLDFESEIAKQTELVKNLAESNTHKMPVEALDNMPDFIRFYQITP